LDTTTTLKEEMSQFDGIVSANDQYFKDPYTVLVPSIPWPFKYAKEKVNNIVSFERGKKHAH
jgi:hypothetical protein